MDELDRALLHPLVTGTKRMDAAYPISVPKSPIPNPKLQTLDQKVQFQNCKPKNLNLNPKQYGTASTRIFLHVLNEFAADTQSVIPPLPNSLTHPSHFLFLIPLSLSLRLPTLSLCALLHLRLHEPPPPPFPR